MKKLIFIGALLLAGCGYNGNYRYECQDPANWEDDKCNPPLCVALGECTKDLINNESGV